jgi:hypothetical protein
MSELLSSIVGGGGGFVVKSASGALSLPNTQPAGDILVITPPIGQRVKLTTLVKQGLTQAGYTITVGSTVVVNNLTLTDEIDNPVAGSFLVGSTPVFQNNYGSRGITEILGGVDEAITVNSANITNSKIYYSYQFGVFK